MFIKTVTYIVMVVDLLVANPVVVIEIPADGDIWIRESHPDTIYDGDGVAVWSTAKGDRRYGIITFDLSSFGSGTVAAASLELYSAVHGWSDYSTPILQSAYVITDTGTAAGSLTWNLYMSEKDATKVALESLGYHDLPAASGDPAQQDQWISSNASANDLALIQAELDGDDRLTIVLIAEESDVYGQTWGDGELIGEDARLTLTFTDWDGGPVTNLSPADGATDVSPGAVLDWQVNLLDYNDPPHYTVYIDTDSNPDDGTIVNINDENITVYDPNLTFNTTYWWRVDVTDSNGGDPIIYTGDTWTFTTPETAQISVETEGWLREQTDSFYEDDGLNIYNSLISSGDQRRISLLEFDLSSLAPGPYSSVTLDLYSMEEWSSAAYPVVSEAFIVEMGGNPIEDLSWTSYFSIYDPLIDPLDTLGAYDYGSITTEPAAYDTYVTSIGSAADLAKVLAKKTGDNKLTIVIKAVETGYEVRADWEDDVSFGNRAFLTFVPLTEKAYSPTPYNEATDTIRHTSLSWQPGLDAISHDIYFGTDFDQVKDATNPDILPGRGNQLLGQETFTPPTPLEYDTTYHWRIDEVSASGTTQGEMWSFTTLSGKAKDPDPVDGAYVVARDPDLRWSSGTDAVFHHIYLSSDYKQIANATDPNEFPGRGVQEVGDEDYSSENLLEPNTVYHWRVDEFNSTGTAKGDVWSFQTTASDPSTCDGVSAMNLKLSGDYNWDCYVDLRDLKFFLNSWLDDYALNDFHTMAVNWIRCNNPADQNCEKPWRDLVITCLDTLIEHGRDVYGSIHTPMFMSILHVDTLTSPEDPLNGFCPGYCENDLGNPVFYDACIRTEGRPCHGRLSPGGTNAWLDQPLIKSMYLCSEITVDSKYAEAADDYMSYMMDNCKKASGPSTGLFYWGSHSYWHAFTEQYSGDGTHEILIKHPDWFNMYRLNPGAVITEVDMIWDRHICNKTTGEHNRHDSGSCGLDFSFSGGSFAMAFSFIYSVTGDPTYLDRAILIADRHWTNRNTSTNLTPEAPTTTRYDGTHCMTSVSGPHVSQLLRCYELTGDDHFRDIAIAYIKAYDQYGWDPVQHTYWGMLQLDGTPVDGVKGADSGYGAWAPKGYIDVWRTSMYSYEFPLVAAQAAIYAYEMSDYGSGKDPELLDIALRWAQAIENDLPPRLGDWWKDEVIAAMPDVELTNGTYAENYGRAISFFVHLYRATQEKHYLDEAEALAIEAVEKLYGNGIFRGHPAKPYYQSNDGVGFLLYALLELDNPDAPRKGAF